MFTKGFDADVTPGDAIKCRVDGYTCVARIYQDDDSTPPWKEEDGHGPVSKCTSRAKRPGERVLNEDHGSRRYYDWEAAIIQAKKEGWDAPPYGGTPGQRAERAVARDFEAMRAWCADEWWYCGIAVVVSRAGVNLTGKYDHALWRVECNYPDSENKYLTEVANELLPDALAAAKAKLAKLCRADVPDEPGELPDAVVAAWDSEHLDDDDETD
jgi:hypothetical protein